MVWGTAVPDFPAQDPLSSPKLRCGSLGQLQSIAGDACGAAEVKEGGTE